jgi:choline dehydrogenase-like flavoprotein
VTAECYVLAGGGIENARLLLASNGVQEAGVGNVSDTVGRYFMEHLRVQNYYRVKPGSTPLGRLVAGRAAGTLRFLRLSVSPDIQRREELLNYHADVQFGYAHQYPPRWDACRRLLMASLPPWNASPFFQDAGGGRLGVRKQDLLTVLSRPVQSLVGVFGAITRAPSLRRFLRVYSTVEQAPNRGNRLRLSPERDALGVPKVQLHWTTVEAEERTYRRSLDVVLDEFEKLEPGLRSCNLDQLDPWPSKLVGNWHHIGTTRMHEDPQQGVVDRDCKVHGIQNLFIAGSSVFPVSASTSPTFTLILLALRLADHLTSKVA